MTNPLYQIADELRGVANLGLHYTRDEYDRERYQKVLAASARIIAALEECAYDKVMDQYFKNLSHVSPLAGAGTVVLKGRKILLIKRHDDCLWAIPGGLVEVGETAADTAKRELFEEVGIQAEIVDFLGVFDSRIWKSKTGMQLYHFVFLAETDDPTPQTSSEALDFGFFSEDKLPPLSSGHHLRIPYYFKQLRGEAPIPYFDQNSYGNSEELLNEERSKTMLTIRCAACKRKLWKYEKIGKGEVLRCYKSRITRVYKYKQDGSKILCVCGAKIGIDKGQQIKMIKKGFVFSGMKKN